MKNLSLSIIAGTALAGLATAGLAETPFTTAVPTIYLNYSNVAATGQSIYLTRLPIFLPGSPGKFIYKDVTIQLTSDAKGVLSASVLKQANSPDLLTANFKPGVYLYPNDTRYGFNLAGPGVVSGNSVSKYEVNKNPNLFAYCGSPAIFYVGKLTDNPYYASRLKRAGITNEEYSYGIVGGGAACGTFNTNYIVGFSQSGDNLSIASFTDSQGDHKNPVVTYTYTRKIP